MSKNQETSDENFMEPCRQILQQSDMDKWLKSTAYSDLNGFILSANSAIKGKNSSTDCVVSETTTKLLSLINQLSDSVDEVPIIDQPQRFGNKAFATWHSQLKEVAPKLVGATLPEHLQDASVEVADYLVYSFGNEVRIDYGTGHELSFVAFLCCYFKLKVLNEEDQVSIILKVFDQYLKLVRKIQMKYRMEAAGSHGVWGLDDFQFLPFLWGSSQFFSHPTIQPKDFVNEKIVNKYHKDFMFLEAIKYINETKTGPFAEHSNQLWNISGVPRWSKVNSGLIKMYKVEVLSKFPVVQHLKFGKLINIKQFKD